MRGAYREGGKARKDKRSKNVNPHAYMTQAWAWWLAGWNDRDRGYKT